MSAGATFINGPAFTLRIYAHLLPSSHDRARTVINERFTRMAALPPSADV